MASAAKAPALKYVLTTTQVYARLGCSRSALERLIKSGRISVHRVAGGWSKFDPSEVDAIARTVVRREPERCSR